MVCLQVALRAVSVGCAAGGDVLTIGSQKLYHHHTSVSHSTHRRWRRATRGNLPSRVVFGRCWAVPTPRSQTLHHDARLLVAERLALPYTQQASSTPPRAHRSSSHAFSCLFVTLARPRLKQAPSSSATRVAPRVTASRPMTRHARTLRRARRSSATASPSCPVPPLQTRAAAPSS
jgi:hypothetical protein